MPKQTFFNLFPAKKELIEKIALKEFSSKPFEEVTVGVIVKECGIPRGSFYQYFEDKVDLFEFLVQKSRKDKLVLISKTLEIENLPYLVRLKKFFIADLDEVLLTDNSGLLRNYVRYIYTQKLGQIRDSLFYPDYFYKEEKLREIYDRTVVKDFNLDLQTFIDVFEFAMQIPFQIIIQQERDDLSMKECLLLLDRKFSIFERVMNSYKGK